MDGEVPTLSDQELVAQSQRGSLGAFEQLVYRYEARVYSFVIRSYRNEQMAREVTQDTFVRAFQAILQFDANRSFIAWLLTIARRKSIDHYRASPATANEPMPELTDLDDPAELLVREEERHNLWELARSRLPQSQFQALWLRYVEGLDLGEIARALGKTKTGIKVSLFRARQTLGRAIENLEKTGPAGATAKPPAQAGLSPAVVSIKQPRAEVSVSPAKPSLV